MIKVRERLAQTSSTGGFSLLGHVFAEDAIICMRVFLFELLVANHGEVSLGRSGRSALSNGRRCCLDSLCNGIAGCWPR